MFPRLSPERLSLLPGRKPEVSVTPSSKTWKPFKSNLGRERLGELPRRAGGQEFALPAYSLRESPFRAVTPPVELCRDRGGELIHFLGSSTFG